MEATELDLVGLRAKNLPRATAASVGMKLTAKTPDNQERCDEVMAVIDKQLHPFVAPTTNGDEPAKCIGCGSALDGFFGSFTWGIVHGEGACSNCGYPARAMHYLKDGGQELFDRPLQYVLQYHPDELDSP